MKFTKDQARKYFEARLGQQLPYRDQVSVRCAFHNDGNPSMSINFEKGVWKCQTGCGEGGLIDFEVKLNGGSREEAAHRIEELLGADDLFESHRLRPTAIYKYTDAQGRLLFEKLRFEPKRFVQRRPLADGKYEYNLRGVEKPLYRLPDLIVAREVFICEGEKDSENVLAHLQGRQHVAATTNFDGAGKWRDQDSPYFTGKRVVILVDNDDPGRKHAQMVAASVHRYAAGVRVVELPDLAEHGDVSDWLKQHSIEDLVVEIGKTPMWRPQQNAVMRYGEGAQFCATAPPEIEWLVEGVIQKGANGVVISDPKVGKSMVMMDLLLALATGVPWLGFKVPRRVRVALCSREDYPGMTQSRMVQLLRGTARPTDFEGWLWINTRWHTPEFSLEDDAELAAHIVELKEHHIEFACFDVFRKIHGEDENDNTEIQKILEKLNRIQREVGCAIALVHHLSKDLNGSMFRRMRGATAIHGWTEWALALSIVNPDEPDQSYWLRKAEFETKAAMAASPVYFQIKSKLDVMWLERADAPAKANDRSVQ